MTEGQVQKWECFIVDKEKASGVPQLEAIGMEKLVDGTTRNGARLVKSAYLAFFGWFHIRCSTSEVRNKMKETVSY